MSLTPAKIRDLNNYVDTKLDAARAASALASPPRWNTIARKASPGVGSASYVGMDDVPEIGKRGARGYTFAELSSKVYTLESESYGNGLRIKAADVADDRIGVYAPRIALLGRRMEIFPDRGIFRFLMEGDQSTLDNVDTTWIDGQPLFSASHKINVNKVVGAGTYSNLKTSQALTADNFQESYADFMAIPDSEGVPLNIEPNVLVLPPQLAKSGYDIVQALVISNSSNMLSNAARAERGQMPIRVVVSAYLSADAGIWYLGYSDGADLSPLLWQETDPLTLVPRLEPTSSNVFYRDEYEWLVKGRSAFGISEPRLIMRNEA